MLMNHFSGRAVRNNQKHIRQQCFLKRRMECVYQCMRQFADESYRINQQKLSARRHFHRAHNRIKRRKQFILCQHIRAAERIRCV